MPLRFLTPYIEALPHVRAIASMRLAEAISIGTGSTKRSARDAAVRRWRADLRVAGARRPRSAAELAAAARAAGIGFVRTQAPRP